MKKIILIGSILLSSLFVQAQNSTENDKSEKSNQEENKKPKKTPEERAIILTERLKTTCGDLTPDQEAKVKAIFLKRAQQVDEIKSSGVSKNKRKEQMKPIFAQSKEELKAVLTLAQIEKIKNAKEEWKKGKNNKNKKENDKNEKIDKDEDKDESKDKEEDKNEKINKEDENKKENKGKSKGKNK